jgi:hypothetical protein
VDEHTISPAGDPFYAAPHAHPPDEDHDDTVEAHYASLEREPEACLCYDGWHFLGHVVELADGEEETEYIRVPCRRCNA